MDLKEETILGSEIHRHWYYQSKMAALKTFVSNLPCSSILDVGAGSGFFSRGLLEELQFSESVCVDPGYPAQHDEVHAGKPLMFRRSVDASAADLVLLMDVLEHVDDDVGLLEYYAKISKPGTYFLITVPAFKFLWSGHDVFLEHRRRYTRSQVESVLTNAGLTPVRSCYFFGAVLPIAAGTRLFPSLFGGAPKVAKSSLKRHSKIVNSLLTMACTAELPFMQANRLGGLSVFALARTDVTVDR